MWGLLHQASSPVLDKNNLYFHSFTLPHKNTAGYIVKAGNITGRREKKSIKRNLQTIVLEHLILSSHFLSAGQVNCSTIMAVTLCITEDDKTFKGIYCEHTKSRTVPHKLIYKGGRSQLARAAIANS